MCPEIPQCCLRAVENISLHRPIQIAEIGGKTIGAVTVDLRAGPAAFPIDPAILPERPILPKAVLLNQPAWIARRRKLRARAALVRIKREPVRHAAQFRL